MFKVFDNSRVPEVFFKLEQCYEDIQLVACDAEGIKLRSGCILSIQKKWFSAYF